jgi:glycosyltransferase involved in cell wall biosynthesis
MHIGFDAKRAFHNSTGLGVYSRTLIKGLCTGFPRHSFVLFNPSPSNRYHFPFPNCTEVQPRGLQKRLPSLWRSGGLLREAVFHSLDLYHGLSNELPAGIERSGKPSVVTIHDLIFEHFPGQYGVIDTAIYRHKFRSAAKRANLIVVPSAQTAHDLVQRYRTPEENIRVVANACDDRFYSAASADQKAEVQQRYRLPGDYILYVGSIIERKRLLSVCRALCDPRLRDVTLIVVGKGGSYLKTVKSCNREKNLSSRVRFLEEEGETGTLNNDLPVLYQMARAFVYPSVYEGFGIPLVEAMASGTPVLTAPLSCLPEVCSDAAVYAHPDQEASFADALATLWHDDSLRSLLSIKGKQRAEEFRTRHLIQRMMAIYEECRRTSR